MRCSANNSNAAPSWCRIAADIAAHQAHLGAGSDHLHAAQLREVRDQRVERRLDRARWPPGSSETVTLVSEVDDLIHRHAVLLEDLEGIGEEPHLVPHARAVQRHQRDALLDAHRLDLGGTVAAAAH